jgi:hypothetical protein
MKPFGVTMKSKKKMTIMTGLLGVSAILGSIQSASANCRDILRDEVAVRKENARLTRNDLIGATIVSVPASALFLPAGVVFEGLAIGYEISDMNKLNQSRRALATFEEAAIGGGETTEKLYKKLKRNEKDSNLSYEDFIQNLREMDRNESLCAPGSVPSKKDLVKFILAKNAPQALNQESLNSLSDDKNSYESAE